AAGADHGRDGRNDPMRARSRDPRLPGLMLLASPRKGQLMAATPWTDAVKSSKQLTVFPDPGLSPSWRATFQSALQEFNRLSSVHNVGVTVTPSATPPDTEGEGGANIRFQTASGTASGRALATDFADAFSGTEVHGFTKTFKLQFGQQAPQMVKALIFVP